MALVKAGADVRCTANHGYDSGLHCGAVSRFVPPGRRGAAKGPLSRSCCMRSLIGCRFTALHLATANGLSETAKALIGAGADVHCKESRTCTSPCPAESSDGCVLNKHGGALVARLCSIWRRAETGLALMTPLGAMWASAAGAPRCISLRCMDIRRRRWRWSRQARMSTARTIMGMVRAD